MFKNFQPKIGVTTKITGEKTKLFHLKDHKKVFAQMLNKGVINPHTMDFDFLDSIKVNLKEKFAKFQLEKFCVEMSKPYPELMAYFLSRPNP